MSISRALAVQLIIDLDGTVLDCRARFHALFRDLAPDSDLDFDSYWKLKRFPRSHSWILTHREKWPEDRIAGFLAAWTGMIETPRYLEFDRPLPVAHAALSSMAQQANLILLTSRQLEEPVFDQLDLHGLTNFFSRILVTAACGTKADVLRAERLTLSDRDMIIGDTEADMDLARTFGAKAISVLSGCRDRVFLESCRPDYIFEDIGDFASAFFPSHGLGQTLAPARP